jgi:hypothetical protein
MCFICQHAGAIRELTRKDAFWKWRKKFVEIKAYVKEAQNVFHAINKTRDTVVKANYALSNLIASHTESFRTQGKFIQGCFIDTAKIMFPYKGRALKILLSIENKRRNV